ncbi:MAG: hypothetical protein ABEJ03_02585 [Candidatus Nanohaloarchaea archaeon]
MSGENKYTIEPTSKYDNLGNTPDIPSLHYGNEALGRLGEKPLDVENNSTSNSTEDSGYSDVTLGPGAWQDVVRFVNMDSSWLGTRRAEALSDRVSEALE